VAKPRRTPVRLWTLGFDHNPLPTPLPSDTHAFPSCTSPPFTSPNRQVFSGGSSTPAGLSSNPVDAEIYQPVTGDWSDFDETGVVAVDNFSDYDGEWNDDSMYGEVYVPFPIGTRLSAFPSCTSPPFPSPNRQVFSSVSSSAPAGLSSNPVDAEIYRPVTGDYWLDNDDDYFNNINRDDTNFVNNNFNDFDGEWYDDSMNDAIPTSTICESRLNVADDNISGDVNMYGDVDDIMRDFMRDEDEDE